MRRLAFILPFVLLGCGGEQLQVAGPTPQPQVGSFHLGPGDVVEVVVWENPGLSRTVPVRPDGAISLPLINEVNAAGLTPLELRDVLGQRFTQYVDHPVVSVIVQQIHSARVLVMGEVSKPGRFEIQGPTTVLDAIALAGGFTEFASKSDVILVRTDGDKTHKYRISLNDDLSQGQRGVWLANGDVVVVK
jgi:polysaccharide export outer membrane protein